MDGFSRGARAQAEITGWFIYAAVRLAVLVVRGMWWLVTRHPLLVAGAVLFGLAHGWSRDPGNRAALYGVVLGLFMWAVVHAARHRPTRGRRWQRIPAYYLRRPDVQAWVTARLKEGHSRAAVAEALRIWADAHAPRHARAEPPRLSRRLRRHVETNR